MDAPNKIGSDMCMPASAMHINMHTHFYIWKKLLNSAWFGYGDSSLMKEINVDHEGSMYTHNDFYSSGAICACMQTQCT